MEKTYALDKINQALEQLALHADSAVREQWIDFLVLLEKWNRTYNLSAVKNIEDMLVRHLFDSIAIAFVIKERGLQEARALDVGTGAGLPGIPLAILFPDMEWDLLDSNGKKTRFVRNVAMEMSLGNVKAINDRVENIEGHYGLVTSRAFASLARMLELTENVFARETLLLAMKGEFPAAEMEELDKLKDFYLKVEKYEVPFLNEERHLVYIQRKFL